MRHDIHFCEDGGIYVYTETTDDAIRSPSESTWLIPGTHPDDPTAH
jgi:hypothetical protein